MTVRSAPFALTLALVPALALAGVVHGNPGFKILVSPTSGWSSSVAGVDSATLSLTACSDSSVTTVTASSGIYTLPTGEWCGFEADWADPITVYATGPDGRVVDVEIEMEPLGSLEEFEITTAGGDPLILALGTGNWLSLIEASLPANTTLTIDPGDTGHDAIRDNWSNARVVVDDDADGVPDQSEWQSPFLTLEVL